MIYYGVPDLKNLERWNALCIPFEYQDFMLPEVLADEAETRRRVRAYQALERDRSEDTLHGPFLDIAVHSQDPLIRQASDYRIRQACDVAVCLGVKAMILHTNLIANFYSAAYRRNWEERNRTYICSLLRDYPGLSVYMENMFDDEPDSLLALAEQMKGERFGICLDIAHAHLSKMEIAVWNRKCAPYICYYHMNDNRGSTDEHLPVGEGNILWENVTGGLKQGASVLLEVNGIESYEKSRIFLKAYEK